MVAVRANGSVHGLTVSAFTPLSLQPPLILVSIAGDAPVASHIEDARRFVVNVLAQHQRRVASRFADRFPIAPGIFPTDGDPIIDGALTALVCDLAEVHPGGDHRIFIGRVIRVERGPSDEPLTYFAREYRRLSPAAETA